MYSIFFIAKISKLIIKLFSGDVSAAEDYTALDKIGF